MSVIKNTTDIPRSIWNKKTSTSGYAESIVFIDNADNDYNLDEIDICDNIEYERQIHKDDKYELYIRNKLHMLKVYMFFIQYININIPSTIYSFKCKW